jgi:hypothetical protein
MSRRVAFSMLLGLGIASLSACGLLFDSEVREPWRAEVEAQCLASGAVHETAGIRLSSALEGPGACGVDHPFRVSAIETGVGPSFAAMNMSTSVPASAQMSAPTSAPGDGGALVPPAPVGPSTEQPLDIPPAPAPVGYSNLPDLPPLAAPAAPSPPPTGVVALDRSVLLSCSMVPAMTRWLATDVQPAALAAFGVPVVQMTSFGSYSCRRRDNARVGRLSEHAFANALDVNGFRLADGRETKVLTGWAGTPAERQFWRDVAFGACRTFTTVLGPGTSDGLHQNHLHLDLARHSTTRLVHVCRPRVPDGWISTAQRNGAVDSGPEFTGSIEEPLRGEDDQ